MEALCVSAEEAETRRKLTHYLVGDAFGLTDTGELLDAGP